MVREVETVEFLRDGVNQFLFDINVLDRSVRFEGG
jgi:hypothetical protein